MNWKRIQDGISRRIVKVTELMKYYLLYPLAVIYRNRDIWIIAERGTDARDNGLHMFRYIRENHPEREVYYIISKKSSDRENVEPYGNVINYGSIKHYLLFIAANVKISTHILGFTPNRGFYTEMKKYIHMTGKTVFLQHGVIQSDIKQLYADNAGADVFICGAKPEYDYIKANYGYTHDEVKYTGLARYDKLHDIKAKKQIVIMPTWRKSLVNKENSGSSIAGTEFINRWNGLLNNKELVKAAESENVDIVFYPHYELQKNLDLFVSSSKNVIIADFAHYDVQQLLKESALLVTDYSSVHFDFAYMGKPCVYYQFDSKEFFSQQYSKGYFDFKTMGFGEVTDSETELTDIIVNYIKSGFSEKDIYKQRCSDFFPLNDKNNCGRIYNEIIKLYN